MPKLTVAMGCGASTCLVHSRTERDDGFVRRRRRRPAPGKTRTDNSSKSMVAGTSPASRWTSRRLLVRDGPRRSRRPRETFRSPIPRPMRAAARDLALRETVLVQRPEADLSEMAWTGSATSTRMGDRPTEHLKNGVITCADGRIGGSNWGASRRIRSRRRPGRHPGRRGVGRRHRGALAEAGVATATSRGSLLAVLSRVGVSPTRRCLTRSRIVCDLHRRALRARAHRRPRRRRRSSTIAAAASLKIEGALSAAASRCTPLARRWLLRPHLLRLVRRAGQAHVAPHRRGRRRALRLRRHPLRRDRRRATSASGFGQPPRRVGRPLDAHRFALTKDAAEEVSAARRAEGATRPRRRTARPCNGRESRLRARLALAAVVNSRAGRAP